MTRRIFLIAVVFSVAGVGVGAEKDWVKLERCELIPNPANDGDSFHVRANDKEYIFRLYLVDAPETDAVNPARLIEQAKYFGISVPQVIELGEAAKLFVQQKLAESFTVFTRRANAMGRSSIERFYAFVQTKEGDLGEQMIANGLARIHGKSATPPGGSISAAERQKLEQLEDEAKRKKIGGWGMSGQPSNVASATPHPFANAAPSVSATPAPSPAAPTASPAKDKKSHAKEKTPLGKIDINTATEKELTTVPGVGHVMAARII